MHSTTCKLQSYQIKTKTVKNYNKMPPSLLLFVSLILTFSTMMQQAVAEDIHSLSTSTTICSKQKCENGCPSIPISHNLTRNDLIENSFTLTNHQNTSTTCVCPETCHTAQNCTHFLIDVREFITLRHMEERKNSNDPCETFFCKNGTFGIHMATCTPVNCPIQHRMRPDGECCDVCDETKSTFCDEHRDCDIGCRYSFVRDEDRNCDLCKCGPKPSIRTSTKTSTTTTTEQPSSTSSSNDDVEATENEPKIFFFFFSSESDYINYLIIAFIFVATLAFACFLAFVIWFLHRRFYKRVPLISHRSYKITQQYA